MSKPNRSETAEPLVNQKKIRLVVAGLGFGASWVPVYRDHPNVEYIAICDTNAELLRQVGEKHHIERQFTSLQPILNSNEYDAVHLLTPIPLHVEQTLAVLNAGKHCACAIPMALNIEDLERIVSTQRKVRKHYTLMETAAYSTAALYVKDLYEKGALGELQFLRGAHYQNMEGWPDYWKGLPPMYYSTHALGPLLFLAGKPAVKVHCLGSGRLPQEFSGNYGNPYPIQTAIFQLEDSPVVCEVTRCLFQMTRGFQERFDAYGDKMAFEWPQLNDEQPMLYKVEPGPLKPGQRGRPTAAERIVLPDFAERPPKTLAKYIQDTPSGNFRPHMVHEFVSSIIDVRPPKIDAATAANWTAAGLCAHESAMKKGEAIMIPIFKEL